MRRRRQRPVPPPALQHRRGVPGRVASVDHLPVDDPAFRTALCAGHGEHVVPLQVRVHQRVRSPVGADFVEHRRDGRVGLENLQQFGVGRAEPPVSLIEVVREDPRRLAVAQFRVELLCELATVRRVQQRGKLSGLPRDVERDLAELLCRFQQVVRVRKQLDRQRAAAGIKVDKHRHRRSQRSRRCASRDELQKVRLAFQARDVVAVQAGQLLDVQPAPGRSADEKASVVPGDLLDTEVTANDVRRIEQTSPNHPRCQARSGQIHEWSPREVSKEKGTGGIRRCRRSSF